MGLGEKFDRSAKEMSLATTRVSEALRRRSAHAAMGLWTWIRHRPIGFLPVVVPGGAAPLAAIPKSYMSGLGTSAAAELKALLALAPRGVRR